MTALPARLLRLVQLLPLAVAPLACAVSSSAPAAAGLDAAPAAAPDTSTSPDDTFSAPDAPAACVPVCPLDRCAQPDGCDALCPPCPTTTSCADCRMRLVLHERAGTRATLHLVFAPEPTDPLPELADIRLRITGQGALVGLTVGEPLTAADKSVPTDRRTGKLWSTQPDGVVRIPALSTDHLNPIEGGTWLILDLRLAPPFQAQTTPVTIAFYRTQDPMLTPPAADALVLDPKLTDPVALWPESR